MITSPSGFQHELRCGDLVATLTEVGAALRTFTANGRPLIDGYPVSERCTGARGHSLIPWPNRIKSGNYRWHDIDYQLDLTEPAVDGAIHGLTRWASWRLHESDGQHAIFHHVLFPCPGWDWILDCRIDYVLEDFGLTVRTSATNLSETACPYGTGAHPYLTVDTPTINAAKAKVPGSTFLPVDDVGIPTGRSPVEGTHYDLRTETTLTDRMIDVTYTDLERGPDGRARVTLSGPSGDAVSLWSNDAYPFFEIFTGDTLPEHDRRRTGLGVEPMTCAPNAFNSGDGLITLGPGQTHTAEWGIEPE
ncbi:MAG: aldose 1-epimerase family protein [Terrimesophilobacter sp.]